MQTSSMRPAVANVSKWAKCAHDDCLVDATGVQCRRDESGELDPATCFSLTYDVGFMLSKAAVSPSHTRRPPSHPHECRITLTHDVWPPDMPLVNASRVLVSALTVNVVS